jgi:tetratricopeptide (TPR) repeat protein
LKEALSYYQEFAQEAGDSPEIYRGVADAYRRVGDICKKLGQPEVAKQAYHDAIAVADRLAVDFPSVPEYRKVLAQSYNNLGILLRDQTQWGEAEAACRHALEIRGQLVTDLPTVPQYRQDLASSHYHLGILLHNLGKREEAKAAYSEAVTIQAQLAANFLTVPKYQRELARTYDNLSILLDDLGMHGEAKKAYLAALRARSIEPNLLPGGGSLLGDLVLRVWSGSAGKHGLRIGEHPQALPVRNGEMVHLEARLNQRAYVYLLWLDSQGNVDPLYPWERDFRRLPSAQTPVEQVESPPEWNKGWAVVGPSGLETALLLARRSPLPADVDLTQVIGKLQPSPFRQPQEVAVFGFGRQLTAFGHIDQNRKPAAEAAKVDEPLLALVERLRRHFEMIRAVRFAHQGE